MYVVDPLISNEKKKNVYTYSGSTTKHISLSVFLPISPFSMSFFCIKKTHLYIFSSISTFSTSIFWVQRLVYICWSNSLHSLLKLILTEIARSTIISPLSTLIILTSNCYIPYSIYLSAIWTYISTESQKHLNMEHSKELKEQT